MLKACVSADFHLAWEGANVAPIAAATSVQSFTDSVPTHCIKNGYNICKSLLCKMGIVFKDLGREWEKLFIYQVAKIKSLLYGKKAPVFDAVVPGSSLAWWILVACLPPTFLSPLSIYGPLSNKGHCGNKTLKNENPLVFPYSIWKGFSRVPVPSRNYSLHNTIFLSTVTNWCKGKGSLGG